MELNGINSSTYTANAYAATSAPAAAKAPATSEQEKDSVVYEKSKATANKTYSPGSKKVDKKTLDMLKADAEARYRQLADLVQKLMTKQGETSRFASLSDLMKGVVKGDIPVDPSVVEQAKKDVAEDGYWGVEQTASRIVDFAKALSGGDSSKVQSLRKAIEKGFMQATQAWGDKLPDISSKTFDRINEMLDEWTNESK